MKNHKYYKVMKTKSQKGRIILLLFFALGLAFLIWGATIMENYEGFKEIRRAAWQEAKVQYIVGFVFLGLTYVLTYRN